MNTSELKSLPNIKVLITADEVQDLQSAHIPSQLNTTSIILPVILCIACPILTSRDTTVSYVKLKNITATIKRYM